MRLPRAVRLTIFIVVVIALIAGIVFGVRALLGLKNEVGAPERAKAEAGETILRFNEGYLATDGLTIRCFGSNNRAEPKWTPYSADSRERTVVASSSLIVMYRDDNLHVISKEGSVKFNGVLSGMIELVRCGNNNVAVYLPSEQVVRVMSQTGELVDNISTEGVELIDMGFFGEDLLWVSFLKKDAYTPSTLLKTYQPNKREMGGHSFDDQLVYDVLYSNNTLYVVGTRDVSIINLTTNEVSSKKPLVYGWQLIDSAQIGTKDAGLLFTLAGESASGAPGRLKFIQGDGTEREIHLPAGCIGAFIGTKSIYGIAPDRVYSITFSGVMTEYALKEKIDKAVILLEGNRLMVEMENEMRTMDLP